MKHSPVAREDAHPAEEEEGGVRPLPVGEEGESRPDVEEGPRRPRRMRAMLA